MGIDINDLRPLGADLLSGSESIMGNLRVLSEEELRISGGGGYYRKGGKGGKGRKGGKGKGSHSGTSKSKDSDKSHSGSSRSGSGCGCH